MPMRWPFQEWGASIVLSGHEHLYERVDKQGFFYVTIGTSGYPGLYPFGDPITGSEKRDNSDYGAIKVSEDKDQLNFQYITRKNIVIDSFNVKPYEKTQ